MPQEIEMTLLDGTVIRRDYQRKFRIPLALDSIPFTIDSRPWGIVKFGGIEAEMFEVNEYMEWRAKHEK